MDVGLWLIFFTFFAQSDTFCVKIALLIHSVLNYCIVNFTVQVLHQLGLHLKLKYCTSYIQRVQIFLKTIRVLDLNHLLLLALSTIASYLQHEIQM